MLLAVTSGSTTAIPLFTAVRIVRVGITCLPALDTNAGTFTFYWSGEREPHTAETMIYCNGEAMRRNFYPPEGSLAGFWLTQNTTETESSVFNLDPDNTTVKIVVDLEFEYVIADGTQSTRTLSVASAFSGIAAAKMPAAASDELTPVGLNVVTI